MRNNTIGQLSASFTPLSTIRLLKGHFYPFNSCQVGLTENVSSLSLLMSLEVCCGELAKGMKGELWFIRSRWWNLSLWLTLNWSIVWQFDWPLETTCPLSKCFDHGVLAAVQRLDVLFLSVRLASVSSFFPLCLTFWLEWSRLLSFAGPSRNHNKEGFKCVAFLLSEITPLLYYTHWTLHVDMKICWRQKVVLFSSLWAQYYLMSCIMDHESGCGYGYFMNACMFQ